MKKLVVLTVAALCVGMVFAQARGGKRSNQPGKRGAQPVAEADGGPSAYEGRVVVDLFPKLGRQATLAAPVINGGSNLGRCYTKPRSWIVLEAKYTTHLKCYDQLTFTWHVMLESKTATENKGNREGLPPYSYFTTSVTYQNIPQGSHAASVCLHPSYLERYGEPKAVGLVITNSKGETIAGNVESEIKGVQHHPKSLEQAFWNDDKIMSAKQGPTDPKPGEPMVERRQGLVDRSKTIWALVNPNDYEMVVQ